MQYSGKYLLSLRWINSQLMVFSNASSNALFLNKPEIEDLLANYKLKTIETAPNSHLILEGTEIKLYQPEDELICQAGRLLLERGTAFNELVEEIFEKIRLIFELNSLLVNIIDVRLHQCCNNPKGWTGLGCIAKPWNERIKKCFLDWSKNLKRTKRENQFFHI